MNALTKLFQEPVPAGRCCSGLRLTGRYLFKRKFTVMYPEEKAPSLAALSWSARATSLCQRRGALYRLQRCVRRLVRRWRSLSKLRPVRMVRGAPHATTSICCKCIFCGYCQESCPVDAIVETRIYEYHFENREDAVMTKQKLLALGDKYEAQLAADIEAQARYR